MGGATVGVEVGVGVGFGGIGGHGVGSGRHRSGGCVCVSPVFPLTAPTASAPLMLPPAIVSTARGARIDPCHAMYGGSAIVVASGKFHSVPRRNPSRSLLTVSPSWTNSPVAQSK